MSASAPAAEPVSGPCIWACIFTLYSDLIREVAPTKTPAKTTAAAIPAKALFPLFFFHRTLRMIQKATDTAMVTSAVLESLNVM